MSLKFNDCHAKIRYVDSQATVGTAVVVQVNPTTIVCESNQSVSVVMSLTRQSLFYLAVFIHAKMKNVLVGLHIASLLLLTINMRAMTNNHVTNKLLWHGKSCF